MQSANRMKVRAWYRSRARHLLSGALSLGVGGLLALTAGAAQAATLTVDNAAGCNDGTGTPSYCTIQAAVNAANAGDTINVAAGTYSEMVSVNKQLTLHGAQSGVDARTGRTNPANETIVRGATTATTRSTSFYVSASGVTIDGFTVQESSNANLFGAGIVVLGASGTHIVNNIVQDNNVGLMLSNNNAANQALVQHNLFLNNNAVSPAGGSAIYNDQYIGLLTNVSIDSNTFQGNENAGLNFSNTDTANPSTNVSVSNNTFTSNGRQMFFYTLASSSITNNVLDTATVPTDGGSSVGIGLFGDCANVQITGNQVLNGAGRGIRVGGFNVAANSNITIQGNTITGNTTYGIDFDDDQDAVVSVNGATIEQNTISGSGADGIRIQGTAGGVTIDNNSIFNNTGLGINLAGGTEDANGVTANDADDPDGGANGLQNYPVVTAAFRSGSGGLLAVQGTLDSTPSTTFTIDLYANTAADASGYGEGQTYIGSTTASTDANGDATFNDTFTSVTGNSITATATNDATGATSEFSAAVNTTPSPTAAVGDVPVSEGNVTVQVPVTLSSAAPAGGVTIDYVTADGTATNPADYTSGSGSIMVAAGATTANIPVVIKDDALDENDETLTVTISNVRSTSNPTVTFNITDNQAIVTINDNDPAPTLSINDVSVNEGESGTVNAVFNVSLSAASGKTVTVQYATANGTAVEPADYTATSGTLTFAPGDTAKNVTVPVRGDALNEIDETFTVSLSNPTNATLADGQGVGTILDNDVAPTLFINSSVVTEPTSGTTNAVFTVTLSQPSGQVVTVNYATIDDSALAPGDYTATNGTLTFAPGETSKTINVAVQSDGLDENNETFFVLLSNATNALTGSTLGTGIILDSDAAPALSIDDVLVREGDSGTVEATFTVTLSAASSLPVSVQYATANDSAQSGSDYLNVSGTLNFAAGITSQTITVLVNGDNVFEPSETFLVNLFSPSGATLAKAQGKGVIANDDNLPRVSILTPSNGAIITRLPRIAGITSNGNISVDVIIERRSDRRYFNGIGFVTTPTPLAATVVRDGNWVLPSGFLPTGEELQDGSYNLTAVARDSGGNVARQSITIIIDQRAPSIGIDTPAPGARLAALTAIGGPVVDPENGGGLDRVVLFLRRVSDGAYFNGTEWSATQADLPTVLRGNTWRYTGLLPSGDNLRVDTYRIQVVAIDRAGNRGSAQSTFSIIASGDTVVSPVRLSGAVAGNFAGQTGIVLRFDGTLDAASATNVGGYTVQVNGNPVAVQVALYDASNSAVALQLPSGSLVAGDSVVVTYDVRDTSGRTIRGRVGLTAR